jgi:asparagine N-glycosylation enzyme membrane subunit Stt3
MIKLFIVTFLILLVSLGIFYTSIFELNPWGSEAHIALISFFISFFCGVSAFFTFLFFFAREVFSKYKLGERSFFIAVRRGVLVAVFFTALLGLQFWRLLGPLEAVLLAIFLSLVEYMLSSQIRK